MSGKDKKKSKKGSAGSDGKSRSKLSRKEFEDELKKLQVELVHLQAWVKQEGLRIIVVFEGRDAAGKGGVIKRITERVSPRVFRVVALPAPTERERTQLYMQRYIAQFPAAGEVILFDRSWYNRAGVERVMGFCTDEEYERFLITTPPLERRLIEDGIFLIKYFFDVSQKEQERRFLKRMTDPMRHWKLSPMDMESWRRWWDYSEAYNRMLEATDTDWAPWYRVQADDKRRARLNCIAHLLSRIPYQTIPFEPPPAGKRKKRRPGVPEVLPFRHEVPQVY
ncbi:MAG: polyphosphate kinase 2 [Candidatus Latescibacterota bacterium]|jgi:polyphosphate kinase 2